MGYKDERGDRRLLVLHAIKRCEVWVGPPGGDVERGGTSKTVRGSVERCEQCDLKVEMIPARPSHAYYSRVEGSVLLLPVRR